MNESKAIITTFDSDTLNEIGAELIELYKKSKNHLKKAQQHLSSAVERRYLAGKYVAENHEEILEECGSQRKFAEMIGITESMVSNDKRGYLALKEEGAETFEDAQKLMQQKGINGTTKQWEKLPKLLSQPESERQKDNRAKDEKRLQQLYKEAEEIRQRNQTSGGDIPSKAEEIESYIDDLQKSIKKTDPLSYEWKSQYYRDWVKSLGMDFLTMNPADKVDPHHTTQENWAGNTQEKVPDCFTIPVTRDTHMKIERGNYNPSHKKLSDALIRTLSLFIITHFEEQ